MDENAIFRVGLKSTRLIVWLKLRLNRHHIHPQIKTTVAAERTPSLTLANGDTFGFRHVKKMLRAAQTAKPTIETECHVEVPELRPICEGYQMTIIPNANQISVSIILKLIVILFVVRIIFLEADYVNVGSYINTKSNIRP